MSCPREENKQFELNKLLEHVNRYSSSYSDWINYYSSVSLASANLNIDTTSDINSTISSYLSSYSTQISSATITNLTAVKGNINELFVTKLTAVSSVLNVVDITLYELSGFQVQGNAVVIGSVSATDIVYALSGNSSQWNSVFTNVQSNSANWSNAFTAVRDTSANWSNAFTAVRNTSANWSNAFTAVRDASANWSNAFTAVRDASANWSNAFTAVRDASANWSNAFTAVRNTSANWSNAFTAVRDASANWTNAFTRMRDTSANYILDGGNTKTAALTIGTNDSYNLTLETAGTARATILNTGNVGIGTTAPNQLLTVSGNISATGTMYATGTVIKTAYAEVGAPGSPNSWTTSTTPNSAYIPYTTNSGGSTNDSAAVTALSALYTPLESGNTLIIQGLIPAIDFTQNAYISCILKVGSTVLTTNVIDLHNTYMSTNGLSVTGRLTTTSTAPSTVALRIGVSTGNGTLYAGKCTLLIQEIKGTL
jgi:hypothetical protein